MGVLSQNMANSKTLTAIIAACLVLRGKALAINTRTTNQTANIGGDINYNKLLKQIPTTTASVVLNEKNCDSGFPCADDHFCSQQWQRCRACSEIKGRCDNMTDIHANFVACEKFCIRMQIGEAVGKCVAEKKSCIKMTNGQSRSLAVKDSMLVEAERRANDSNQKHIEKDRTIEALENRAQFTEAALNECKQHVAAYEEEKKTLTLILISVTVGLGFLFFIAGGLALYFWRKSDASIIPDNSGQDGAFSSAARLLQPASEVKTPVEEVRRIYYDSRDLVLPGGAVNGHPPGPREETEPA